MLHVGDAQPCEVLPWLLSPNHLQGGIPRPGGRFSQVAIPGYKGHIAGKVAENMHGQTFCTENECATQMLPLRRMRRTASVPETISAPSEGPRGLSVAPRVPGFAGHIPGKVAETVHGLRFAEANEAAQDLRERNPHMTCEGWMRRGRWPADRMATYKWNNRSSRMDTQELFTAEQEREARESNRLLGQTFGLNPPPARESPAAANAYRPDRFLQLKHQGSTRLTEEARTKSSLRTEEGSSPTGSEAAGRPSVSAKLDIERIRDHRLLGLGKPV